MEAAGLGLGRAWILVLFLLLPLAATADHAIPLDLADLATPAFSTFSLRDGLPPSILSSIAVDREGFVWVSSPQGLLRYDGHRWESEGEFALRGSLGDFLTDADGELHVVLLDRGIAHLVDGRWEFEAEVPATGIVRLAETVAADGTRELWALTEMDGLWRRAGTRWVQERGEGRALPGRLRSLAATRDLGGRPRIWIGSRDQGLWYREADGGAWQQFAAWDMPDIQVNDLLVTRDGDAEQLWITTFGAGLWRLDERGLTRWSAAAGQLPSDALYRMARSQDADGHSVIWAGSRGGLVRVHHDVARTLTRKEGLPSDVVRDLHMWPAPDGSEVLWLATEDGVARVIVDAAGWQVVSRAGDGGSGVFAILVEADGKGRERLWVGSDGDGLQLYEDGRWRDVTLPGIGTQGTVRMIRRIPDGSAREELWIGLTGGVLLRSRDGRRFEQVEGPWSRAVTEAVLDLLPRRDRDGSEELWAATRTSGAWRLRDGHWEAMGPPGVAGRRWSAWSLTAQKSGDGTELVWVSSSEGLLRYDGERLENVSTALGASVGDLFSTRVLRREGRDELWAGSMDGIQRVDVTDPMQPRFLGNSLPAPPDPVTYGAWPDSRGRIWVCTNNGAQLLEPRAGGWNSTVFTRRDGLPHDECNFNGQFVDAHDRFWLGTLGGLGVYDPAGGRRDGHPKPLHLVSARADEQGLDPQAEIVIPPGTHNLALGFALLSWRNEEHSEFRTELQGFDAAPTAWTLRTSREFARLPPGEYLFRIEGRDYAGNESTPLEVPIRVLPAWWQTWFVRWLFVLALLGLLYLLFRWRVRAFTLRQAQLETEVAARTNELHVANARLRDLSYHDPLTGLANRRRFRESLAEVAGDGSPSHALLFVDVDHFKDYNDRFGHPAGDEALKAVASAIRRCLPAGAPAARHGGEEFTCLLPRTSLGEAMRIGEELRASVEQARVPMPGSSQVNQITISVGVAARELGDAADADELIREADQAMYRAKAAGRNCVRS